DTNVIVYTDDRSAPAKQKRALSLFAEHRANGSAVVSIQVLQEYFAAATRKLGVAQDVAQNKVQILARCRVVRFNAADIVAAIEFPRLHPPPSWAALILHAARQAGADGLYSEDFHTGARLAGVRIVNPFA